MKNRDIEQQSVINLLRKYLIKNRVALIQACTGFGKGELIRLITSNSKTTVLVIVPRVNLVRDLAQRTGGSIYCATLGKKEVGKITIATKQSIKNVKADIVIVDEAHNYPEYWLKQIDSKYIVGMTATPFNDSGFIYGENKFWPELVYEFGIEKAIEHKYLCDYKIFGSQYSFDISDIKATSLADFKQKDLDKIVKEQSEKIVKQVEEIVKISQKDERKKIVILCTNIEHAKCVYAEILKYEKAYLIHSKIKNSNDIVEEFKNNSIKYAISVLMLSEGFDCPSIDCVVFLRATKSTRLMIQASGRGLRLHTKKDYCLFLDYGDVFDNCGEPKFPQYNFQGGSSSSGGEGIKTCQSCFYKFSPQPKCPNCGHENVTIQDNTKNLKHTLFDFETEYYKNITISKDNLVLPIRQTKKGSDMLIIKHDGNTIFSFGYKAKKLLSECNISGKVNVYYKFDGKFNNVIRSSVVLSLD